MFSLPYNNLSNYLSEESSSSEEEEEETKPLVKLPSLDVLRDLRQKSKAKVEAEEAKIDKWVSKAFLDDVPLSLEKAIQSAL